MLLAVNGSDQLTFNGSTVVGVGSIVLGTIDTGTPGANGAQLTGTTTVTLTMQSASATVPGLVNNSAQTFSGVKTFTSQIHGPSMDTFIFQPGGTAAGNVYTTWASLYAALPSVASLVWIVFDSSLGSCTIPAGTYAFKNVSFECPLNSTDGFVSVGLDDGCVFSSFPTIGYGIQLTNNSTTAVYTISGNVTVNIGQNVTLLSASTGPLIDVPSGSNLTVLVNQNTNLVGSGKPLFKAHGTGNIGIYLENNTNVQSDVLVGDAGSGLTILVVSPSALYDPSQPSFAGTKQVFQTTSFYGLTSGQPVTLSANASTAAYPLVLPAAQGGASTTLVNDGAGNLTWGTTGSTSPLTTKGDLYTYSTVDARLGVGTNGQILSADSTQTTGLKWIANSSGTPTPTASTTSQWDANVNFSANSFIPGFHTQAAANSTKTMVITDAETQEFTGSTAGQIVKLPTTGVTAGKPYTILNNSTQVVTVQSSGANTIQAMAAGTELVVTALVATPTTAANWSANYSGLTNGGSSSLSIPNVTDWVAYTPTFTGGGTPSAVLAESRRVGSTLEVRLNFTSVSSTATEARISIGYNGTDGNVTIDSTATKLVGYGAVSGNTGNNYTVLAASGNAYVTFGDGSAGSAGLVNQLGSNVWGAGDSFSYTWAVPISGWTATTNTTIVGASVVAGVSPTVQKFTSGSGTYTTPAGVQYISVKMVGGGGGGGSSGTTGTGGGGGTGGTTTFGTSLLTATGGAGGAKSNTGGTGPAGGTATVNSPALGLVALSGAAGAGDVFYAGGGSTSQGPGPSGASSPLGGAGAGVVGNGASAVANTGSGGAAGGVDGVNVFSGASGAAGAYIEAIITSPSSTYSYAVGAAGANAGAGTLGHDSGSGGSGYIEVTEYYTNLAVSTNAAVSANLVLAGPTSGAATTPAFRSLVTADLPSWTSEILVTAGNGYGAVNTSVVRFSNTTLNNGGSDISYTDSSNNGGSFTINTAGRYAITFAQNPTNGGSLATIEKNSTSQSGMTSSSLAYAATTQNKTSVITVTTNLVATDIIRFTGDGAAMSTNANFTWARITRLS